MMSFEDRATRSRRRGRRRILRGLGAIVVLAAGASCGSRTGLFLPEPFEPIPDASFDVQRPPEAGHDAALDAPVDAPVDAPDDGPIACVPGTFTLTLATPQLVFVLDRSGSMEFALGSNSPPPPGQPTRWTALRDALAQAMLPFTDQIAMGARFYPAANVDPFDAVEACSQDPGPGAIPPALGNADAILDVFDRAIPVGGTPTAVALSLAAQQLSSSRAVARAMVLATDGAPNCNRDLDNTTCTCTSASATGCQGPGGGTNCLDDVRTIQTLTTIADVQKIPVYVVGIGVIASFASTLDAMAVAGGRPRSGQPRYYPAETPADLMAAFTTVRDSVARCSYVTPSSPVDPDAIAITVGGDVVPRDPTRTDGWDWIDQAYGHLQLFGSACAAATQDNVSGTVACETDR